MNTVSLLSLPLSLPTSFLFLSRCLTKSLAVPGLPPVSAQEIQGLPGGQSKQQRPAAPLCFPSFFLPSCLISSLKQGGVDLMMGDIPLLVWYGKKENKSPKCQLFSCIFLIFTYLYLHSKPQRKSSFLCLFFSLCLTSSMDTHTSTPIEPLSLQSVLSLLLIRVSSEWEVGVSSTLVYK